MVVSLDSFVDLIFIINAKIEDQCTVDLLTKKTAIVWRVRLQYIVLFIVVYTYSEDLKGEKDI